MSAPPPRHFLLTSRFTDETWAENQTARKKTKLATLYCSPARISQQVPEKATLFILELNISTNKIMGVGMLLNIAQPYKYSIYQNGNFNRYVYCSAPAYISRADMSPDELKIMSFLDIVCFRGNFHMKRGNGITLFPQIILTRIRPKIDLLEFFKDMFRARLRGAAAAAKSNDIITKSPHENNRFHGTTNV